ncbi:MAG: tetratricopeptide repeat protein [Deltaproteobacteria bacterium]|nr:tetratricopeptide repeat protein [Deltaproteobacteria bacterium]
MKTKKSTEAHSKRLEDVVEEPTEKNFSPLGSEVIVSSLPNRFPAFMAFAVIAGFLVYLNALFFELPFTTYSFIEGSQQIKSLSSIPAYFLRPFESPLRGVLFSLEYAIWGVNPYGFHLINNMLHAVASVCVGLLARELFTMRAGAFSAVAFALYPVNTDAVTGLGGAGEILAVIFTLLSICFFIRSNKSKVSTGSIVFFILALFSSVTALALPFILIIYLVAFVGLKEIKKIIPFFIILIIYLAYYLILTPDDFLSSLSFFQKTLMMLRIFGLYFLKLFIPLNLSAWYEFLPPSRFLSFEVIIPLQVFCLSIYLSFVALRYNKRLGFIFFFILLSVLPSLHLLPLPKLMSESNLYLPSVGLALLFGLLLSQLSYLWHIKIAGPIALVFFIVFSVLTYSRNMVWHDNYSLLSDTVIKSPRSVTLHYNLGLVLAERGDYDRAIEEYTKVIELNPQLYSAYYNIACVHALTGKKDKALHALKWAVARGFNDLEQLRTDPELDSIRGTQAFSAIIGKVEAGTGGALH